MSMSKEDLEKAEAQATEMLDLLASPEDALIGESREGYEIRKERESINQNKKE